MGYSPNAAAIVTVITVERDGIVYGVNAWKSNAKRLNPEEFAALERIAERRELPVSTIAREHLLRLIVDEDAAADRCWSWLMPLPASSPWPTIFAKSCGEQSQSGSSKLVDSDTLRTSPFE